MHTHPVILHWKGETGTLSVTVRRIFRKEEDEKKREEALKLCKSIVTDFAQKGKIFAYTAGRGKGKTVPTYLLIDFKDFKVAKDVEDDRRPLTLLRFNDGKQPVLLCRPYPDRQEGFVLKVIPLHGTLLVKRKEELHKAIDLFIDSLPKPEPLSRQRKYHPLNADHESRLASV